MNQSVLQGRLDTFRSAAICSPLMHAEFQDRDRNFLYVWGMDYPFANGVMEKSENSVPSELEIEQTIAYFSAKNFPFVWWTWAKNLETKGFQFGGILKGIALDISEGIPSLQASSDDLEIIIV